MEQPTSQHQQALNAAARESAHKERVASVYTTMERDGLAAYSETSDARILPQLEFMQDQISKTMALLRELEESIEPILLPSFPSDGNKIGPRSDGSAVSMLIDQRNTDLSEIQHRIREIQGRVQL